MIVWALFDSGNGCYSKAAKKFEDIEIYSIGLDYENKNRHFISLNLADYSILFGDRHMFDTLDELPKPDLIIASPPCESWSVASALKNGNACWKREDVSDSLFQPQVLPSPFTIRTKFDYDYSHNNLDYSKQFIKRVNGELTVFNTIRIIKEYNPKIFIIENPASGKIWEYIETVIGFNLPYKNLTRYNNYDYPLQKPTKFASNVYLGLKNKVIKQDIKWGNFSKDYNERSNIPASLVEDIFRKVLEMDLVGNPTKCFNQNR
ncbi:DNA cytosine methyltransferase [Enterococcus casseliflavus]|uniref:DNA methyltransferase n=1 Tax=Enterococcus casseliflavus TaxID=37734 RepID=UPI0011A741F0|nr:DNA methyltransferase [Enterococcus casseliflavus]